MNGSLFSITRYMYMNGVCFKVSGGTSVPKLPPSYPPPTRALNMIIDVTKMTSKMKGRNSFTKPQCLFLHLSHLMGKPTIRRGENKGADQLRGNREADQRLCFRYTDSTMPLLSKSKISSL